MNVQFEQTPQQGVSWHEFANVFPMLQGAALEALRDDIRVNGVREPVVFLGKQILDGRNRYMCARELGIEYPRREFGSQEADGSDPLSFVISHNLTRRHLNESQRASAAAKVANMKRGGMRDPERANLPNRENEVSTNQAASMLSVSERSVKSARKVQDQAPELVPSVDEGSLSVSLAAQAAALPRETREEIADTPAQERKAKALEEVNKRPVTVTLNTGKVEWYTPSNILDAARETLGGFDLDPASSQQANENVGAARIFTAEDDGLVQEWPRGRIWMNPPYAANTVDKFVSKFCAEVRGGSTGCVLVNNATETGWFQDLLAESAAVCLPKSRIRFICPQEGERGSPLQGQAIFYFGLEPERFHAAFESFGHVLEVRRA